MTNQEQYEVICEKAEKYDKIIGMLDNIMTEITNHKKMIDEFGENKKFIEIIKVAYKTGTESKPYYVIKYLDTVTNEIHVGYGSYSLEVISEYLRNDFGFNRDWEEKDND